jgi:hypothetical protein
MITIHNVEGKPISTSRNLRGIQEFARKHAVDIVNISALPDGAGTLTIFFSGGYSVTARFNSFTVLESWVRARRNFRGAGYNVNGAGCGLL